MSTPRVVASILACTLALSACSNSSSKSTDKPAAPAPAATAQPAAAPVAASPAAAPAAGTVPPSGNPATKTNPKFYLPTDAELTTTASGLKYMVLREGSGTSPTKSGRFSAHYCGWFTNGESFDSSYERNEPLNYPVARMIAGWQEALVMMKPGCEYILVVPPDLGYGPGGNGMPPNATLVFRMELLSSG